MRIIDRDKVAYLDWCEQGFAQGMPYMVRDPQRRTDPQQTFPGAKSVLSLGVSYYQGPFPKKPGPGYGRVARYAWGLDYHTIITQRLEMLLGQIKSLLGTAGNAFLAVDTKPLLERSLAQQAGLGFVGKNTVLIIPQSPMIRFHVGSWIFLAEILLDVDVPWEDKKTTDTQSCGACTRCLIACPTNAFDGPYRLNANKCISYLTIENKGEIPVDMRPAIGDWIFGCDVCQDVCPFNARAYKTRWPEFQAEKGVGGWVPLQEILELSDDASFKKKYGPTPLSRPKRRGLIRNACVVAGNSGDKNLLPVLEGLTRSDDSLIRDHALWAVQQLKCN